MPVHASASDRAAARRSHAPERAGHHEPGRALRAAALHRRHPGPLAVTIDVVRGWALVINQPQGPLAGELGGRRDESGIDAMLYLATTVNTGHVRGCNQVQRHANVLIGLEEMADANQPGAS